MPRKSWKNMTKAEQRVAIAKDVIKQIYSGVFRSKHRVYVELPGIKKLEDSCQINKAVKAGKITCTVCAKGALFMAVILKENHFDKSAYSDIMKSSDIDGELYTRTGSIFSQHQLDIIETAFERTAVYTSTALNWDTSNSCLEFGAKYKTHKSRLIGIMEDIIENKGTFKP